MKGNQTIKNVQIAVRETLSSPMRWFLFFGIAFVIFSFFVLIPVWTTPGNDILFQLSIFKLDVYLLMITLSLLNALVIVMQFHVRHEAKKKVSGKHAATGFGIVTSSIAATIACASCYSSILALFGLGGTLFIVEHRWWFAIFALGLSFVAIVYTSKRVAGGCESCTISVK